MIQNSKLFYFYCNRKPGIKNLNTETGGTHGKDGEQRVPLDVLKEKPNGIIRKGVQELDTEL